MNEALDKILAHHGIKGMKWGVRRRSTPAGPANVTVTQKKKKLVTKGGSGHAPTEDATRAAAGLQKARASGTHALTTAELRDVVQRLNLEQQYSKLAAQPSTLQRGQKATKSILEVGTTVNSAIAFANSPAGKALKATLAASGATGKHHK